MRRQELLDQDSPPEISCVLDEAAVQRTAGQRMLPGPDGAAYRAGRQAEYNSRDRSVQRRISPRHARAVSYPGVPDHEDSDVLFSESSRDMILSRDESGEIAGYRAVFEDLRDASLGEVGTLTYLRNLASQI